jgi:Leucine-rich repeat (LRR) protein
MSVYNERILYLAAKFSIRPEPATRSAFPILSSLTLHSVAYNHWFNHNRTRSRTALDLDSNQLAGKIPTELGQLLPLNSLDIGYNQWTGTIPAGLGRMLSLESLDKISNHQFTETMPTGLGKLVSLESRKRLGLGCNTFY